MPVIRGARARADVNGNHRCLTGRAIDGNFKTKQSAGRVSMYASMPTSALTTILMLMIASAGPRAAARMKVTVMTIESVAVVTTVEIVVTIAMIVAVAVMMIP